jgi:hypothetical protein
MPIKSELTIRLEPPLTKGQIISKTSYECPKCKRHFKSQKNYQIFCSQECENYLQDFSQKWDENKNMGKCFLCSSPFRKSNPTASHCETCIQTNQKRHKEKLRIQKNLKNNADGKRRKKGLPLYILNEIEERKRVFRDSGWTHYIKGRKWDKI